MPRNLNELILGAPNFTYREFVKSLTLPKLNESIFFFFDDHSIINFKQKGGIK